MPRLLETSTLWTWFQMTARWPLLHPLVQGSSRLGSGSQNRTPGVRPHQWWLCTQSLPGPQCRLRWAVHPLPGRCTLARRPLGVPQGCLSRCPEQMISETPDLSVCPSHSELSRRASSSPPSPQAHPCPHHPGLASTQGSCMSRRAFSECQMRCGALGLNPVSALTPHVSSQKRPCCLSLPFSQL